MNKEALCYKVVSRMDNGTLISFNTNFLERQSNVIPNTPYVLEYTPGIPTVPKIPYSKLFAFDTIGNALNCHSGFTEIWASIIVNPRKLPRYNTSGRPVDREDQSLDHLDRLWDLIRCRNCLLYTSDAADERSSV